MGPLILHSLQDMMSIIPIRIGCKLGDNVLDSLIKGMELSLMLLHIGMELVASGARTPVVLVALVPAVGGPGSTIGSASSSATTASVEASAASSVGVSAGHLVGQFF